MKYFSIIFISYLFIIGCSGSNQSGSQPQVAVASASISEDQYNKLLSVTNKTLERKALSGELGNCQLQALSQGGCERGEPAYGILLINQGIYFPNLSQAPNQYCKNEAGKDLRLALQEGYCFAEQVSYDDFSDDGLKRKARMGQLGKCKVDEDSSELRRHVRSGDCS
jgi:hypothetical protein